MAQLWINNAEGKWELRPLGGAQCLVVSFGNVVVFTPAVGKPGPSEIRLLDRGATGASQSWTLLGGRDATVCVNGQSLVLGIRALRHGDEIMAGGRQCFFSLEELACVVAFPGLAQTACCPRCKQQLEPGQPAVACPHCHAWHHQSEEFPCWTYDATCALCQIQSTELDAGYSWTPEQL